MIPPQKLSGGFSVKKMFDAYNKMVDYVTSITPRQGHGTRVHHSALGSMTSAQPGGVVTKEPSDFQFRGVWAEGEEYKEGDIVYIRGAPASGAGPESSGTFWCVLDHTATVENYPKELLPEQQDPVSGEETDIWRTFAAGAWETLTIRAFPIKVVGPGAPPPIVIPAYTYLSAGSIACLEGGGSVSSAKMDANGDVVGIGGPNVGQWELKCVDLPASEIAKFRLMQWCENDKQYTAYFQCTEKKEVPGQ